MTLLEVMLALTILAIGLLALTGMQAMAFRSNGTGFKSTTAIALADQGLTGVKSIAFANLTAGSHTDTCQSANNGVTYSCSYTVSSGPVTGVYQVVYTVGWHDTTSHSISLLTWVGNGELL